MVVLDGVVVYTAVDVPSTVLVGCSVVEGEMDVDFVVSTVVTASVVLASVTSVSEIYSNLDQMLESCLEINLQKGI